MTTQRTTFVPAAALLLLTACGIGGPSRADIESGLRGSGSIVPVASEEAECVARVLDESDLTSDTLSAIADKDASYQADAEEQAELTAVLAYAQDACPAGR